jgi:hypothetical protein
MILIQGYNPINNPGPILKSVGITDEEIISIENFEDPGLQRLHEESTSTFENIE